MSFKQITQLVCKYCSKEIEKKDFEAHTERLCENKPKFCRFCETYQMREDFKDHVVACSSRTKLCHKCKKNIILRGKNSRNLHIEDN